MIDWAERSLCILLSLGILMNALVVRRLVQAWAFPAVLFSLAWFIYTIVPLVCFPDVHVYPIAMLYILCASIAVSIAGTANWKMAFARSLAVKSDHQAYYGSRFLLLCFVCGFFVASACMLINSVMQGISLSQLITNINDSAAEYAGRRYSYDIEPNAFQQIGNILAYFCAGLGGLIIVSYPNKYFKTLTVLMSLFPSIFVMLSQSAKGMLFLCAAIFFGGFIVARIQRGNMALFSKRAIPATVIGLLSVIGLVTASFISRGVSATAGGSLFDALAPYWASYTSGHLFAFSDWFGFYWGSGSVQSYDDPGLTKGFYTFMSIFKIFGDDRPVPLGVYAEYFFSAPYIETNIYTVFRGMIQDFGVFGSLVVLSLLSFATHRAFKSLLGTAKPTFSIFAFLFAVSFIYQSFIISAMMWMTLPVGLFLISICLFIMNHTEDAKRDIAA